MTDLQERLRPAIGDRYVVVDELGAGGMATVYLARDLKHRREVAIKVLKPELAAAIGPERFLREIEIAARLSHPHILPLHDSGHANGLLFYVMPYVDGGSLRERIDREGALPLQEVQRITRDVAEALDYAHAEGVVHRDIKPGNILLSRGHALIADFGVARALTIAGADSVTAPGLAVGTPAYMSPEQASGAAEPDGRSDLYSLGCVTYEMLTGEPPYTGTTLEAIIAKRATDPIPSARKTRKELPPSIDAALTKALAKTPQDRFPSTGGFSAALATPVPETEAPSITRRRALIAVVALLVLIAAPWIFGRSGPDVAPAPVSPAVAIFPFSYSGSAEYAYLEEGIAELLATKLDMAGLLRAVRLQALLSFIEQERGDSLDHARATERLGAELYVVGGIVEVDGTISITASLHDLRREHVALTGAEETAGIDQTLPLVDRVAAQLLADYLGDRRTTVASLTTDSLNALKAYIEGRRLLRVGQFTSAGAVLERAIGIDSSFALAWDALATALGFGFGQQSELSRGEALEAALRHGERLPLRDRQLIEARLAEQSGSPWEAERLARQIVGTYPDDFDAWFLLAETLLHHGLRDGRSPAELRQVTLRTLELAPSHPMALGFLLWLEQVEENDAAIDSIAADLAERHPSEDWRHYYRAVQIFRAGDRAATEQLLAGLARQRDHWVYVGAYAAALEADSLSDAIRAARLMTAPTRAFGRPQGQALVAHLLLGRGNWSAAQSELRATERMDHDFGVRTSALLLLARASFVEASAGELESSVEQLTAWSPNSSSDAMWRTYLLGHVSARSGDDVAVSLRAAELNASSTSLAPETRERARARDLSLSVQAHLAWRRGQPEDALLLLDRAHPWEWWPVAPNFELFGQWAFERFLRAKILTDLGRYEEALHWYAGLGVSPFEVVYRGPKHLRMGEIYERLNEPAKARDHYARALELWNDADLEFRSLMEAARAGLARTHLASANR